MPPFAIRRAGSPRGVARLGAAAIALALAAAACVESGGVEGEEVERGNVQSGNVERGNVERGNVERRRDARRDAEPAPRSRLVVRDDFERTVDGGWGGDGAAWTYEPTAGEALELAVADGRAVAAAPAGVNKGNLLVGPPFAGDTSARATFTIELVPRAGETNHPHVLLRSDGLRTYYAFLLYPRPGRRAVVTIFSAKHDRYETLGERLAPFVVRENEPYVVEGRARDRAGGVDLELRAWAASARRPHDPLVAAHDGRAPIRGGRAGVRLSFYGSRPSSMTIDDFVAVAEASAGAPETQP